MAFFSNRVDPGMKEEMRVRFRAPSFSLSKGEVLSLWTLSELKKAEDKIKGRVVILHPGLNLMLSPRLWMKELGCAYYLIICTGGGDEYVRRLRKEADRIVYGLVPKSLTGVAFVSTREEAESMINTIIDATGRESVTIDSTEGESECSQ